MIIDTAQVISDLRFWIADWRGRCPRASSPKPQAASESGCRLQIGGADQDGRRLTANSYRRTYLRFEVGRVGKRGWSVVE